jgi:hypothetical protein
MSLARKEATLRTDPDGYGLIAPVEEGSKSKGCAV